MTTLTDGRDIDRKLGQLTGEGALQRIGHPERQHVPEPNEWHRLPEPDRADPTYYNRPLLKQPVWEWGVPLYYFVGGATGASLAIGAAAQLDHRPEFQRLIRHAHIIGAIGSAVSGALLVNDLGRPARFLNMLRVFRPTSAMNVGSWILSTVAPCAFAAVLFAGRRGFWGTLGRLSGLVSGIAGLGLSTYTGVLVSNTTIPVWQEGRRVLPILFGSSAVATAGSLFDLLSDHPVSHRVTRTFGTLGRAAELAAGMTLERQVARKSPLIAQPFKTGASGAMWRAASVLTAGSLVASLLPGASRRKRVIAGALGIGGSLLLRFAIHHSGVASSRDPRAVFAQQRATASQSPPQRF